MPRVLFLGVMMCLAVFTAKAQDPVKVDPKHYKVEFENAQVRVLRIHYGPHEKSVMHDHPAGVPVFLTDQHVRFTYPDGKTEEFNVKTGETRWSSGGKHLPENLSDQPFALILIELKGKRAPSGPFSLQKPPAAKEE